MLYTAEVSKLAPCSSICWDKSLLKHYVGWDRDKSYNIMSIPAISGQLATMTGALNLNGCG